MKNLKPLLSAEDIYQPESILACYPDYAFLKTGSTPCLVPLPPLKYYRACRLRKFTDTFEEIRKILLPVFSHELKCDGCHSDKDTTRIAEANEEVELKAEVAEKKSVEDAVESPDTEIKEVGTAEQTEPQPATQHSIRKSKKRGLYPFVLIKDTKFYKVSVLAMRLFLKALKNLFSGRPKPPVIHISYLELSEKENELIDLLLTNVLDTFSDQNLSIGQDRCFRYDCYTYRN